MSELLAPWRMQWKYWLNQYVRLSGNLMQEVRRLQAELERKEQRIKELESRNGN